VRRAGAFGVLVGLALVASSGTVDAAPRGGFFTPGLAPRAPEVMLYFSHSVGTGAGASMRPTLGLRVQQVRQAANTGDPEQGDGMQHRELINWQMEAHSNLHLSDLRVKLGNRVTYDVTNRRFGSPPTHAAMQIGMPSLRSHGEVNPAQSRPLFARGVAGALDSGPVGRDTNKDNSNIREIAVAAMGALAPARFTSAQRHGAQRQGGIAGVVAAQRMQGPQSLR
jgi:hypothetical protein